MSIKRKQDIIQLKIAVDNPVRVEVLEGQQDLGGVELGLAKGELLALDVQHEITTADVLHDRRRVLRLLLLLHRHHRRPQLLALELVRRRHHQYLFRDQGGDA